MTPTPILLTSPDDILGAVPYLLGFHPADSLVVIAFTGRGVQGKLRFTTRWDLPQPPGALDRLVPLLRREDVTHVILAGFGTGPLVTPAVDEALRLFRGAGVEVIEALRAHEGRYWSYVCPRVECCPPEGRAYDTVAGPVAARATVGGLVALPDRESLRSSIAPLHGAARTAMAEATRRVAAEIRARLLSVPDPAHVPHAYVGEALDRVRRSLAAFPGHGPPPDPEAARLGFDLAVIRVRDEAWTLMDDATQDVHVALWADLTRRLETPFVPPVASLLAAAAWRRGDCALAGIAVERALAADPSYSMAGLLAEGLRRLIGPDILRDRMPTSKDLDTAMGPPRMDWLHPLLPLLDTHALPNPEPK
ncbi:hypothetical protein Ssi03_52040 [Sphaerisporangium siamense]|uniref:DUF4192 domain-containing protein n=1 Tax=Sphaerisporangium siamense TaxID=795645 RepID=A0A7W7DB20_9ACTN|nr:DUF4192 domain-containing protein [Sphaerisporangium siamense]MBB4702093.1 hypothetical protein [Sphaerisporangium siamense]GII87214.1 hypothetical protein Ssi03_52040 [Sphaerisporangium siamense]